MKVLLTVGDAFVYYRAGVVGLSPSAGIVGFICVVVCGVYSLAGL